MRRAPRIQLLRVHRRRVAPDQPLVGAPGVMNNSNFAVDWIVIAVLFVAAAIAIAVRRRRDTSSRTPTKGALIFTAVLLAAVIIVFAVN